MRSCGIKYLPHIIWFCVLVCVRSFVVSVVLVICHCNKSSDCIYSSSTPVPICVLFGCFWLLWPPYVTGQAIIFCVVLFSGLLRGNLLVIVHAGDCCVRLCYRTVVLSCLTVLFVCLSVFLRKYSATLIFCNILPDETVPDYELRIKEAS